MDAPESLQREELPEGIQNAVLGEADTEIQIIKHTGEASTASSEQGNRRPGRPKGSRNKNQREKPTPAAPKALGRPRGTGHLQKARALAGADLEPPPVTRPVGRPPKLPPPRKFSVNVGTHMVKGRPAVIRSQPISDPDETVNRTSLHPIFTPQQSTSTQPGASNAHTLMNTTASAAVPLSAQEVDTILDDPSTILFPQDGDPNDESGLLTDGVGAGDDDEETDSEEDADLPDPANNESEIPRPRRTARKLPQWLQSQFDAKVNQSKVRGNDGLPPLYRDHKTFWFPTQDAYFPTREVGTLSPTKLFQAPFLLWDPAALVFPDRIPCPNCGAGLTRRGHVPRPRRCVDLNGCFYIIGYRYQCSTCVHPKSKKKTVTFRSYDSRILKKLPRALSAAFPAMLTYRSGISENLFMFMRSCFQSGMGSKQFADALRVRHLEHYDKLQVSYLSTLVKASAMSDWRGQKFQTFLPFEDVSPDGYHGFVPSSQWLRDLFDKFIELHGFDFDQAISLLSASICAIDHSFKLAKHIAKVNGEQIFIALLTVTNEKGEIRVCNLVATKSHSQFELALNRMRESLLRYGHDQPQIFYTDNMADKEFLERCFPSLREAVIAVEKYAHLPPLEIPATVQVDVLKNVHDVNEVFRAILQDLPDDENGNNLVLFIDSEWNVEISERGYITGRGATAILQIAYKNRIHIIQIGQMLAAGTLPQQLRNILLNPRVLKVGRAVSGDLRYLQESCRSEEPFRGAVDLAQLAKDRLVVSSAKIGLADLCAKVLGKRVDKNVAERISSAWEGDLSSSQIRYASLDVHACRCIYDSLVKIPIPSPLPDLVSSGTPILLFHDGHSRLIARGTVASLEGSHDGINITRTRCLIEVTEVVVPAAIITTHKRTSLSDLGDVPFRAVCLRSHLRLATVQNLPTITPPTPPPHQPDYNPPPLQPQSDEEDPLGLLLSQQLDSAEIHDPATLQNHESDPESEQAGARVLAEADHRWGIWKTYIRSRVIKDAFHIFNMFYIPVIHGLRVEFARALRDAIFIPDAADKARIIAWGLRQSPPKTWESLLRSSPKWLWRRCKRIIPPPEELYPLVAKVFQVFGHLKDAKTGIPLFNSAAWAVAKNILELVQKGFCSDPPGISLYTLLDHDKYGLPLYLCDRGTNFTEGGVHTHLRSRLPTSGASVRHINASLKDFILRHNLVVGTYNSTGRRFKGHYSIWVTNEIQELLSYLEDILVNPRPLVGWVNGNLYQPTNEVTGVLPIPEDIRVRSGMAEFEPSLDSKRLHHHLASLQGTRKAVLPVHNDAEKILFRELMSSDTSFRNFASANQAEKALKIWNAHADRRDDIYYKLPEQLKVYYTGDWQKHSNVKQTKAVTANARSDLMKEIHDPRRAHFAPPVPQGMLRAHFVSSGMLPLDSSSGANSGAAWPEIHLQPEAISSSQLPSSTAIRAMAAPHSAAGTTAEVGSAITTLQPITSAVFSGGAAAVVSVTAANSDTGSSNAGAADVGIQPLGTSHTVMLAELSKRRVAEAAHESEPPPKKARQARTCTKCGVPTCPGKNGYRMCRNACRDCGKAGQNFSCTGRNSKKLNYTCTGQSIH